MIKYVLADIKEGTITNDDQEENGLSFEIRNNVIQVDGDEGVINKWITRINGVETNDIKWKSPTSEELWLVNPKIGAK